MEHTRSILMHEYDSQSALNDCDAEDEHQMEFVSAIWTASIFQVFDQWPPSFIPGPSSPRRIKMTLSKFS